MSSDETPTSDSKASDVGASGPWVDALEAIYETELERIVGFLPPMLEPAPEPLVRMTISVGTAPDGTRLDHVWCGVAVRHEGRLGEYAVFVGAGSDHEVIEGRERLGEPRKLVTTTSLITGSRIQHKAERRGHVVARIVGTVSAAATPERSERTEYGFRYLPAIAGGTGSAVAELMRLRRTVVERRAVEITGAVRPGISPFDPLNELTLRRVHSIRLSQRTTTLSAQSLGPVPADHLDNVVALRYDPPPRPTSLRSVQPVVPEEVTAATGVTA